MDVLKRKYRAARVEQAALKRRRSELEVEIEATDTKLQEISALVWELEPQILDAIVGREASRSLRVIPFVHPPMEEALVVDEDAPRPTGKCSMCGRRIALSLRHDYQADSDDFKLTPIWRHADRSRPRTDGHKARPWSAEALKMGAI